MRSQVVDANRMASTPYDLAFRVERTNQTVCKRTLSEEDLERFRDVSVMILRVCLPVS